MATQALFPQQHDLIQLVQGWNRRLRWQQTVLWLPRSLMPGLFAGSVLFFAARFTSLVELTSEQVLLATAVLTLAGLLFMLALVWLRPQAALESARRFDLSFSLDERISTALELIEGRIRSSDELFQRQIQDAWTRGQEVQARDHLPLEWDRRAWGAIGIALLTLLFFFLLPPPQMTADTTVPAQQAAIDAAADAVERLTQEIASDTSLSDEERQQLLQQLEQASDTLNEEGITPEEAFATLTDTEAVLQQQAQRLNEQSQQQQQALQEASNALSNRDQNGQQQQGQSIQDLAPLLRQQAQSQQQAANSQNNPSQTQQNPNADAQSQAQQQQTADSLQQAADALQQSNPELSQALQQAADAMRNGDQTSGQQAMQNAAVQAQQVQQQAQQQAQSANQMQAGAQQLQQASSQVAQQNGPQQQGDQSQSSGNQQQQGQQPGASQSQAGDQSSNQQSDQGQQGGGSQPSDQANPQAAGNQANQQGTGAGAGDQPGGAGDDQPSSQANSISQDNSPDGTGQRDYSPVYAPRRPGGQGGPQIVLEPDASNAAVAEGDFAQNPTGQSLVPYNQVYSDYSNAANRALDSDYIPLGLRDVVHDYFSSLEPGQQQR